MARTPFGLRPVRYRSGGAYTGAVTRYKKEASVILAIGDPVVKTGDSETGTGIELVNRAVGSEGSTASITGVVVAIDPIRSDLSKTHMAAADTGYVYVCDDPDVVFQVLSDEAGTALATTDVGRGAKLVVANANTTTGTSNVQLDSSTATGTITSGTCQVMIIGYAQIPGNPVPGTTSDRAVVEVIITDHTNRSATQILV
jgi:hypothetical protein